MGKKVAITVPQVLNHLEKIAKNGNKNSIKFLNRNHKEILTNIWNGLDITAEQSLRTVWRTEGLDCPTPGYGYTPIQVIAEEAEEDLVGNTDGYPGTAYL